ncbi:MAG: hypothetical protein V4682_01070 [Patescibacteria group bacterium]
MILIHLTVTDAVRRANDLEGLMKALQSALVLATEKPPEEIAISGGTSECMTAPYGAMMGIEFHYDIATKDANKITEVAVTSLAGMLSVNLVQRSVIGYPSIRSVLPPIMTK